MAERAGKASREGPSAARRDADPASAADGDERSSGGSPVCPVGFCPIGVAMSTMQSVQPDAVEHLLVAGRELLLAARAVIDQRVEDVAGGPRLEKIEIG